MSTNTTSDRSHVSLPPPDACIEIASAYFTYIHDPSHNLFHRPSFMTELLRGEIAEQILYCVVALAARLAFGLQTTRSSTD